MNTRFLGRTLGVLALLGLTAYAVPPASASAYEPGWSMNVENVPAVVAAGGGAGFRVTIDNPGSTNITHVVLRTDTTAKTTSVTTSKGNCAAVNKKLRCSLGTVKKHSSITVFASFPTKAAATSFAAGFYATATIPDGYGTTQITLRDPYEAVTVLSHDPNFAGGYSVDGAPVGTDSNLTDGNLQSTTVTPPHGGMVVTAQDGLGDDAFTCTGCHGILFGEWSSVNVDNGSIVDGLIKVTLLVRGDQVPDYDNAHDIVMVHVLDDGTTQILDQPCGYTPTANCIDVHFLYSDDVSITAYVTQNGGFKGMG